MKLIGILSLLLICSCELETGDCFKTESGIIAKVIDISDLHGYSVENEYGDASYYLKETINRLFINSNILCR